MSQTSPRLTLPYLQQAQAQKHVTHNEALERLDVLVQLTVQAFDATTPPASPAASDVWALGTGATGDWAGQDGDLACWSNGGWMFVTPAIGWRATLGVELRIWSGTAWEAAQGTDLENIPGLGVNTTSDVTNRVSVAADATLLSHDGAGHQLKLNKATSADTASLVFQTGFSGRAEMGTAGNDDFAIKVSDGGAWATAMVADAAGGRVVLPNGADIPDGTAAAPALAFENAGDTGFFLDGTGALGLATDGGERVSVDATGITVTGLVSGTAVTQSEVDQTTGRLVRTGDFGLGTAVTLTASDDLNELAATGLYYNPTSGNVPGNNYPLPSAGSLLNLRRTATNWVQTYSTHGANLSPDKMRQFTRSRGNSGWTPWVEVMSQGSMVGAVSHSGGQPTGAMVERGANANGDYVRFADGTQICSAKATQVMAISTAFLGGFRSATQTWNFPAQFASGSTPIVTGGALEGTASGLIFEGATTVSQTGWAVTSISTQGSTGRVVNLSAVGRWY